MPDHVHFFSRRATVARPMAEWMQMWKSVSSRQLAAALNITTPIWQPEYFDRYLRSRENYGQKWNYVKQNALRAGLIKEDRKSDVKEKREVKGKVETNVEKMR